ncbi:class I SAM-dependent methyltransferase [Ferruginibacter sp. SUN106]|uniref:class I SAM-dependent methyltransferase n=1 Tax=Ferruginibacter sp. SUN106 TaxID=2978348 RepID=UPI003D36B429
MDRKYWETIAPNYDEEIFDVLQNDVSGSIVAAIEKMAAADKTVIDIGCAVGKWIPVLAPKFKQVIAADISAKNLEIAKERYPEYDNVEYHRMDMSANDLTVIPCDVAICINAILTASLEKRINFFQSLSMCLNKGGQLVLVVPSLESKLYTNIIADRWNVDDAENDKTPALKEAIQKIKNFNQGVTDIDNVPTKHYLKEELQFLLAQEGFEVTLVKKINYPWTTEFHKPPKWLAEPYPWDWMCTATKKS